MDRTVLTISTAPGAYAQAGVALTMAAADVANKNQWVATGKDLVVAHNTGASAYTVTITSVPDPQYGRTGDVTNDSIPAGEYRVYGPFPKVGWVQTDTYIRIEASNASVKLGVVKLP